MIQRPDWVPNDAHWDKEDSLCIEAFKEHGREFESYDDYADFVAFECVRGEKKQGLSVERTYYFNRGAEIGLQPFLVVKFDHIGFAYEIIKAA